MPDLSAESMRRPRRRFINTCWSLAERVEWQDLAFHSPSLQTHSDAQCCLQILLVSVLFISFSYISLYSTFFVREGGISSFLSLSLRLLFPLSLPLLFLPSFSLSLLFPRLFSTFHLHLVGGQSTWSGMSDFFTLKKIILILINTVMA